MKTWLVNHWESLRANFWFVPTVMVAGAVVLSLVTINLDKAAPRDNWIATLGWTFTRGPEGSRAVLSTVAASMMTITSVTFSITIVALQLASSQFGPRLLRNFMRDRGNQVSLGIFIATFAYCLLVLRTVNGTEGQRFVPHISVTVGLLMALTSLGVLIYFIHHAAASIQAENVIANVGRDLDQAIARLYPECLGVGPSGGASVEGPPPGFDRDSRPVAADFSDYLQNIDIDRLMDVAREHDLVISVPQRPGKFLMAGADLARVCPGDRLDEGVAGAIRKAFYLGPLRTLTQDVEFAIDQLVEIAVRALSPGVNDPFTAINCVDRLGAALVVLGGRDMPSTCRYDGEGRLRVVAEASTVEGIVNAAFDQVRQAARTDAAVTLRLLETLAAVAVQARGEDWRAALRRQVEMVHRGSQQALPEEEDRREADDRLRVALRALESGGTWPFAQLDNHEESSLERFIRIVPPNGAVEVFGVKLVGVTAENGTKLLFSLAFVVLTLLLARGLRWLTGLLLRGRRDAPAAFWARQGIHLVTTVLLLLGLVSVWFDDPTRLTTALGLVTAGLAFALQKVVTSIAGYFVILRGRTFNVGDRITMGGVRGDVIALGFIQTTIMEMGQPPAVQNADPAMWVHSRQYTGRIVTVSNSKIFDEPVYNYTRDFPYIWEEMTLPITYTADRSRAESILMEVAGRHTVPIGELGEAALLEMERRYIVRRAEMAPRVYYRLTDNWLELTVRFIARDHGIRELKDAMSREILTALDEAGIGIASATFEVVGLPPLRLERAPRADGRV